MEFVANLAQRVLAGESLDRGDLVRAAELSQEAPHDLLRAANDVRRHFLGDDVTLCCIVPGRLGGCSEDCRWCSQSRLGPLGAQKPAYTADQQVVEAAHKAQASGAGCMGIVNSGRRPSDADLQKVIQATRAVAAEVPGLHVCASLGELTPEQARQLAAQGTFLYHHNLETSRRHYAKMVTTHTYDDRLQTLRLARQAGMDVCSGGLLGLGETWEDRVDLALTLRDEVAPPVVPLNFLHAIPGTPMEHQPPMAPMEILRAIAIFRLAMPRTDIKVCGGRVTNLRDLQSWVFYAGASSLMTGDFLTTAGRASEQDLQMIRDLGLRVVSER